MVRCLTAILFWILFVSCGSPSQPEAAATMRGLVKWVDDGDSIGIAGGERVRYLGINAPELAHDREPSEPYGEEARIFNEQLVLGRWVRLELGDERRDRYGRLLAYVFLEDGRFINGELVRQGFAHLLRRQTKLRYWKSTKNIRLNPRRIQ